MENPDLILSNYDFDLPPELIAARPAPVRHESKLLVYIAKTGEVIHTHFYDLPKYLPEDSLLVVNQSKVFPCRLVGQKPTGGKCEIFVLSLVPDENSSYEVLIKTRSKKKIGDQYLFDKDLKATVSSINEGTFRVTFNVDNLEDFLNDVGKIPIPPYIRGGESDEQD